MLHAHGAHLGGLHLEMTGDDTVTECVGGPKAVSEDQVPSRYTSYCDPRLSFSQAVLVALELCAMRSSQSTTNGAWPRPGAASPPGAGAGGDAGAGSGVGSSSVGAGGQGSDAAGGAVVGVA